MSHVAPTTESSDSLIAHNVKGYGLVVMTNAHRGSEVIAEVRRRVERAYRWDTLAKPVPR